jgi:hypothetical protein
MERPEELIKELNWNERWLNDEDKYSAWYREYLAKLFEVLDKGYKT